MYILDLNDNALVDEGQHASGVHKLIRSGFQQQDGFVLSKAAHRDFISPLQSTIDQLLANVDYESRESLNRAAEHIENMILGRPMSADMRSEILEAYKSMSYTASISDELLKTKLRFISSGREKPCLSLRPSSSQTAPLLARFTSIRGDDELLFSIKKCWASLFSPEALYYRHKRQFSYEPIAIVIQKTINAEKSGFVITSFNKTQMLIEAIHGLVDTLRRNEQTGDKYFSHKILDEKVQKVFKKTYKRAVDPLRSGVIKEPIPVRYQDRPVLNDSELNKLGEMANDLESSFGPSEYEWAILRGKVYITDIKPFFCAEEHGTSEGEKIADAIPVSAGTAKGAVSLQEGSSGILFLESISEKMLFDLVKASGIITKSGNICSIISDLLRELEIPYVIANPYLQSGENVAIDGSTGLVYIVRDQYEQSHPAAQYPSPYPQAQETRIPGQSDKDLGISEPVSTDILSMPPMSQEQPSSAPHPIDTQALGAGEIITATDIGCFINKESYTQAKNILVHGPKNLAVAMASRAGTVFWLQDDVGVRYDDYNEPLPANIIKLDKPEEFGPESKAVIIRTPADASGLEKFLPTAKYVYFNMENIIKSITGNAYSLESTVSNETVRKFLRDARQLVKKHGRKTMLFSTIEDLPEFVKIGIDIIFVPEQDFNNARLIAAKTEKEMLLELCREKIS